LPETGSVIFIGKITGSHGLGGFLKVIPLTDFSDRFDKLNEVYLFDERKNKFAVNIKDGKFTFRIEKVNYYKNQIRIKFFDIDSKSDSDVLKSFLIAIDESNRIKIKKGGFYYYEIINHKVIYKNKETGLVEAIENYGGDDLLKVNTGNKYFYIPIRKEFIKKIDNDKKEIEIDITEGLLDI